MSFDPKVAYWTAALLNMVVIVASATLGVFHARRREFDVHRRRMLLAAWLVLAFLASYGVKVWLLGREALEQWAPFYVQTLRFHEVCVGVMVAGGITALVQARRLELPRGPASRPLESSRLALGLRWHRGAGRAAVVAAYLGVTSAAVVLWGMYARLG